MTWTPFHFLIVAISGWMNREQQQVIDYLREENRKDICLPSCVRTLPSPALPLPSPP